MELFREASVTGRSQEYKGDAFASLKLEEMAAQEGLKQEDEGEH
jgi:hypothetical protein